MSTSGKSEPKVRTVPRGYPEPGVDDDYPDLVADKKTGEMVGHAYVEDVLPDTAKETNAPA